MKSIYLCSAFLCASLSSWGQEPADALKFSWLTQGATARIQAIGGANISLGGDISATFINPAGLAFYRTGDFVLSPAVQFGNNNSTYRGNTVKSSEGGELTWGTSGIVLGSSSNRNGKNVAFSLAVNRSGDFYSRLKYGGPNNQSSFSQRFVEELQNNKVRTSSQAEFQYPLGASLAYNTRWIDSVSNASGQIEGFKTNAPVATGLLQQNTTSTNGGISEFALGIGATVSERLMVGGTLGIPILNYTRNGEFVEADATTNRNNKFDYGIFTDQLQTEGAGINLRAGIIYKPATYWRLGFTFHSPSFYSLTDRYQASVILNDDVPDDQAWQDRTGNYIDDESSEFKYFFTSPYRVGASVAYVLREVEDVRKQRGFLTADVEFINYASSSFSTDPEGQDDNATQNYLKTLNRSIDQAYKPAFNIKAGGELKFTTIMLRAGAAYYGNPYKNIAGENGSIVNITGGAGYRHKGFFADLAYVHGIKRDVHFAYRLQSAPYSGANVRSASGRVLLTLGVKI